jgi:hypothetical protein
MRNYIHLGKLPQETINFFKQEIYNRKNPNRNYQWVEFDNYLNKKFREIWENDDLELSYDVENKKWIQKAFFVPPNDGWKIHKDGIACKTALNISLQSNESDWVRWYDEDYINSLAQVKLNTHAADNKGNSRNIDIDNYEEIPYIEEVSVNEGDVYLVNTDVYHSFKCNGPKDRIIVQTKFRYHPDIETVYESLKNKSFTNLI